MATKIQSISKSKTIDFGSELLQNFWRQKSSISVNQNHKSEISKTIQTAKEGIVCIQTEALTDKGLIKQIFNISQNLKVRFYILVNEYSQELDLLNEICLIRYDVKNIGSFVLINPNSDKPEGRFFTGQLTEQSIAVSEHISRSLDTKETEELFRHFCFQFWETAKKEVIEKGKRNDVKSKPLDVFHDINVFDGKDFVYGTLFDFVEKAKRSDLSDKQIIYQNKETEIPTLIKTKTEENLGNNVSESLLPKNEFENQEPKFLDDGVSVSIEYKWQNVPFYLPEKATDNSLYERWKNKNKEIVAQLDSIVEKIKVTKEKKGLSNIFSKIIFKRNPKLNEFENEIKELKLINYSELTEIKLKEKIKRINEIHNQVTDKINEIDTEDKNARLDEEIEILNSQLVYKESELNKKKEELETKKERQEKKLIAFCEENNVTKDDLIKLKSQWEQGAKNKKYKEKMDFANQKLDALRQIQKDVFLQKCIDDTNKIEQEIKRLENAVKSKEQEKNKQVEQSSSSSLNEIVGDKNSKQTNSVKSQIVQMPDFQQLPTIGKLFQVNNQPYLAIEFWEEYEQGVKEADRLKAKLCAIKN